MSLLSKSQLEFNLNLSRIVHKERNRDSWR